MVKWVIKGIIKPVVNGELLLS